MDRNLLESAQHGKGRQGKAFLVSYLKGGRLTRRQAIVAKCYECDGMGETGECTIKDCTLYPYSPYGSLSPKQHREALLAEKQAILEKV